MGWANAGEDPQEHIARLLTGVEREEGFERLAKALAATLEMSVRSRPHEHMFALL